MRWPTLVDQAIRGFANALDRSAPVDECRRWAAICVGVRAADEPHAPREVAARLDELERELRDRERRDLERQRAVADDAEPRSRPRPRRERPFTPGRPCRKCGRAVDASGSGGASREYCDRTCKRAYRQRREEEAR